jgi:PAS domain S-box-containing protein
VLVVSAHTKRFRRWPAFSARAHLIALALTIAIPLVAVSGLLIYRSVILERAQLEQRMVQVVNDLVNDVDRELTRHIVLLRTLAALPSVRTDLSRFYEEAKVIVGEMGIAVFLIDPGTMKVVLSTLTPYGAPLPTTGNRPTVERIAAGQPYDISDIFVGAVSKRRVFDISVPVVSDGELLYILTLTLRPNNLLPLLQGQTLDPHWVSTVWDRAGVTIAHSEHHEALVGKPMLPRLRALPAGSMRNAADLDGAPVLRVNAQSILSGWGFSVHAPVTRVEQQLRTSLMLLISATVGAVVLAIGVGTLFARAIARPLSVSSAAATALGRGQPIVAQDSGLTEANIIMRALKIAQKELNEREAAVRHLAEELSSAADAAEFGSYDYNIKAGTLGWSRQLKRLLGAEGIEDEPTFNMVLSFIHPDDRTRTESAIKEVIETGREKHEFEFRIIRRDDGTVRWILNRGGVIKSPDGRVERVVGVLIDITHRKAAELRQQLLLNELKHRVKNTLSVVQSIASQTIRSRPDPSQFMEAFASRIASLARSHDLLTQNVWQGAALRDVVETAMKSFQTDDQRIAMSGPDNMLSADAAVSLSLLLHELATNAAKYGALSEPNGRLLISWSAAQQGAEPTITLLWEENGGPPVKPPQSQGFGSRLVHAIAAQLNGTVKLDFAPEGVRCQLNFPMTAKAESDAR